MNSDASTNDNRETRGRPSRRAEFLLAARKTFAERGYHRTHVSDLIAEAGVARGTFYLYFESKNAVFLELLEELLKELRAAIVGLDMYDGAPPIEEQLVGTVARVLRAIESEPWLAKIIFREAVGLDESVDERLKSFYGELQGFVETTLRNGKELGLVKAMHVPTVASCILGSVKYLVERTLTDGALGEIEEVARTAVTLNLHGVLNHG